MRQWLRESAGAVADLGVLVPIAVGLIVLNGLSPTAVLLPAGLLYLAVARVYALPIAVQPLKAFGAIAIAIGAGPAVIAAGALLMGLVFTLAGRLGLIDTVARLIPPPVVRGVQLTVAVLLAKVGVGLVIATPSSFTHQLDREASIIAAGLLLLGFWWMRGRLALLVVLVSVIAIVVALWGDGTTLTFGPSAVARPELTWGDLATAATLLVLPQLPLTFANSCLAPADAARRYFGDRATPVTPGRLAVTLGLANLVAAGMSGMPVCHGAGGLSAHYAFGARTWRAPAIMGSTLVVIALAFGSALGSGLPAFPVSVLAALLGMAAITHAALLRDVRTLPDWAVVIVVAALGVSVNLAYGVLAGLALASALARVHTRR